MLEKLENELKNKGCSQKTVDSYMLHNNDFLKFINKEPEKVEEQDIKNYLSHLTTTKKYKPRSVNLALAAVKFYFYNIMNKKVMENIKLPKIDKKQPISLTKDEVKQLINSLNNPKHKLLLRLMACSGLRVGEAITLKISDVNLDDKTVKVKSDNGKERITILSEKTINNLKEYLAKRQDKNPYLFHVRDTHVSIKLPQKIIKSAARKSNLNKRIFCQALRSSFSNILLENGLNSRYLKSLLGNSNSDNPVYSKMMFDELKKIKNPLEDI